VFEEEAGRYHCQPHLRDVGESGTSDQLRFFGFTPKMNADAPRLLCFLGRGLVPIRTEFSRLGVALQTQTIATG
jgi:hypothetical protein